MVGSCWWRGVTELVPVGREWIWKGAAITGPGLVLQAHAELTTARTGGTTRFAIQANWTCQLEEVIVQQDHETLRKLYLVYQYILTMVLAFCANCKTWWNCVSLKIFTWRDKCVNTFRVQVEKWLLFCKTVKHQSSEMVLRYYWLPKCCQGIAMQWFLACCYVDAMMFWVPNVLLCSCYGVMSGFSMLLCGTRCFGWLAISKMS